MRTLDELLDEADQFIALAEQAEGWDIDTIDTANGSALAIYREVDRRLRAGEPVPACWRNGR